MAPSTSASRRWGPPPSPPGPPARRGADSWPGRGSAGAACAELLKDEDRGVDLERFERTFNLKPERHSALYAAAAVAVLGKEHRTGVTRARRDRLREAGPAGVRDFHRSPPPAGG